MSDRNLQVDQRELMKDLSTWEAEVLTNPEASNRKFAALKAILKKDLEENKWTPIDGDVSVIDEEDTQRTPEQREERWRELVKEYLLTRKQTKQKRTMCRGCLTKRFDSGVAGLIHLVLFCPLGFLKIWFRNNASVPWNVRSPFVLVSE